MISLIIVLLVAILILLDPHWTALLIMGGVLFVLIVILNDAGGL